MSSGAPENPSIPQVRSIRFGDYQKEVTYQHSEVSYRHLMNAVVVDSGPLMLQPPPLRLRPMDVYRLLAPYFGTRFGEQVRAVIPLALYLAAFQFLVLRQSLSDSASVFVGLLAVLSGLMFFMEGLKLGLMPMGEMIGNSLPTKSSLPVVLLVALVLGIGVTLAEPAVGALQTVGSSVDPQKVPFLHAILRGRPWMLVLAVGIGVGIATVLGTLRSIYGWSLKILIYVSLLPTLVLTAYCSRDPDLIHVIGLAWDCGGVTTGPVTVTLVLALGIGVASSVGKSESPLSGFGIVTLASLYPVTGVLLLGIFLSSLGPAPPALDVINSGLAPGDQPIWYQASPVSEILLSLRAIVPLVLFLFLVLRFLLDEPIRDVGRVAYGLGVAILGMILFNIGLTYGLSPLGGEAGGLVPGTFTRIDHVPDSPLFSFPLGVFVTLLFAWIMGFGATLAEPALNAMGLTAENLSNGLFKKSHLIYAVSFGVGVGISVGVAKIIFGLPLHEFIVMGYAIAMILTALSLEEFVNLAWDSAGVTTGPVTVPLVLAMGLGLGRAVNAVEGFGVLAAASLCPIVSVLVFGFYVRLRLWARRRGEARLLRPEEENMVA